VLGDDSPSRDDCPDCPVVTVDFHDVGRFLAALNERSRDMRYRLPTEAEWEYACRAGTDTPYSFGDQLPTDMANWNGRFPLPGQQPGEARGRALTVASFPANAWGIHDMHGNVWEWTADWHGELPVTPVTDPTGPARGTHRVIRGGSYLFDADSARCGLRYTHEPPDDGPSLGFRIVAEPLVP